MRVLKSVPIYRGIRVVPREINPVPKGAGFLVLLRERENHVPASKQQAKLP